MRGLRPLLDLPPVHIDVRGSFVSSFHIRAAQPGDVEDVFALVRALAEYEKLAHQVSGTGEQLREELFGPRPVVECVVAREGTSGAEGAALGFALFFHNYSTFLARRGVYLEDLFVVPQARGRGIGRALIAHVANVAVQRDCGRFEWAVLDWNRPAIAFYESLGATVMPDWRVCRLGGAALQALASGAVSGDAVPGCATNAAT